MSHTTKRVNGIDVRMWDEATNRMDVQSEARSLAGTLPRGGELSELNSDGRIYRIDGPAFVGGEMTVWVECNDGIATFTPPEGYRITEVSAFDSNNTAITIEQE